MIDPLLAYSYSRRPPKCVFREVIVLETGHLYQEDAIFFPSSLSSSDPDALFELCSKIAMSSGDVVLDASELAFIDPLGLAALRATLESQGPDRDFVIRYMGARMVSYLARMEFFEGLNVEGYDVQSGRNPQGEPDNCVELLKLTGADQSEEVASRLVYAMTGVARDPNSADEMEPFRRPLEYALKELLENALSHAKREGNVGSSVWVACQHFLSPGTVRLAIVDNGCGFLATLKNHAKLRDRTHGAAIEAALMERVSCNRGPNVGYESEAQNQGVGLTTTAKIAAAADGALVIVSGDAWVRTDCGLEAQLNNSNWKGVAIAFSCKREMLPQVDIPTLLPKVDALLDDEINFE